MSGALGAVSGVLSFLQNMLGSRSRLLPASFRGINFYVATTSGSGGRRLVTHEFPLRDAPYTEDLGKLPRRFKLHAFVIDSSDGAVSYLDARDRLIKACEANGAATLVHPTHGPMSCRAGVLGWSEQIVERFGYCDFQLDFVIDGPQPGPAFTSSTMSRLLGGIASLLPLISDAYNLVIIGLASPAALLSILGGDLLGLPPTALLGLANTIAAALASPGNASVTAMGVQAVMQGVAANVITAAAPSTVATDAVTGVPFTIAASADPSGGLASLGAWGSTLPAISTTTPLGVAQAAMQAAVVALVQGNAIAALVQVYAQIAWPYASAAAAARTQVVNLIETQIDAAANTGADALYQAWQGLQSLAVADMIASAQSLPALGSYVTNDTWPSLALAQALFQDPAMAAALEDINDVPHPLFMPVAGRAVVPVGRAQRIALS